ncbi:hypothetical protein F2Q69_00031562 [Brassica cretica]|uniref:Uncharacterized protein n=1 Tax=Brassica cretica TaxID=69181 RepID=A0A8S9S640_BRACR|nr:hypothetical protein F2Q69_00031562 [Brassica cretica]
MLYISHSDETERLARIERVKQGITDNASESSLRLTRITKKLDKGKGHVFSYTEPPLERSQKNLALTASKDPRRHDLHSDGVCLEGPPDFPILFPELSPEDRKIAMLYISHSDETERLARIERVKQGITDNASESSLRLTRITKKLDKGKGHVFSYTEPPLERSQKNLALTASKDPRRHDLHSDGAYYWKRWIKKATKEKTSGLEKKSNAKSWNKGDRSLSSVLTSSIILYEKKNDVDEANIVASELEK